MAKIKVTGVIKKISDEQRVNQNLKKKSIFLETAESKPNSYEVVFWNQKIDLIQPFGVGEMVEIECYLNGKYYQNPDKEGTYLSLVADSIQAV